MQAKRSLTCGMQCLFCGNFRCKRSVCLRKHKLGSVVPM